MRDALRATGARTKREVVELGLRKLLGLARQAQIRKLKGQLLWEGDLKSMRTDR
jgi:Arc/MetJ family transcription regulator